MLKDAKYRAKRKGLPFTLDEDSFEVPDVCPVLGTPLRIGGGPHSPSLDRIVPEIGYIPCNVLVVSQRVNQIKQNATPAELEEIAGFYREYIEIWINNLTGGIDE